MNTQLSRMSRIVAAIAIVSLFGAGCSSTYKRVQGEPTASITPPSSQPQIPDNAQRIPRP